MLTSVKEKPPMAKISVTVDEYLASVPEDARAALEDLRKKIKAAAPRATESISYRIPIYKLDGRHLVGFAAFKDHCSFFVMSSKVINTHTSDLKGYTLGKGTIHFSSNKPLPTALVKKIVKARMVENKTTK
jgi:uncharacterized protein YdhG (YjbR/CyaY superfamily)